LGTTANKLNINTPLKEFGMDSLMAIELKNWIEKELDVSLSTVELLQGPSVSKLTEKLEKTIHDKGNMNNNNNQMISNTESNSTKDKIFTSKWVEISRNTIETTSTTTTTTTPTPTQKFRLFTFSYLGGDHTTYDGWSNGFQNSNSIVEIVKICLPGRNHRLNEEPLTDWSKLLQELTNELLPLFKEQDEVPFAFYGHSLGALVAYELSLYLQVNYGISPVHLFVASFGSPDKPNKLLLSLKHWSEKVIEEVTGESLILGLNQLNVLPETFAQLKHLDIVKKTIPAIRGDLLLLKHFDNFNSLKGNTSSKLKNVPITCFGGKEDSIMTSEDFNSWQLNTDKELKLFLVPGGHLFVDNYSQQFLLPTLKNQLTDYL